jgi:hypothetical protein
MPYLVVKFTEDNSFTIINDKTNKLKNVSKATVKVDDEWQTGSIIYRNKNEQMCEKWAKMSKDLNESSYAPTDDECGIKEPPRGKERIFFINNIVFYYNIF